MHDILPCGSVSSSLLAGWQKKNEFSACNLFLCTSNILITRWLENLQSSNHLQWRSWSFHWRQYCPNATITTVVLVNILSQSWQLLMLLEGWWAPVWAASSVKYFFEVLQILLPGPVMYTLDHNTDAGHHNDADQNYVYHNNTRCLDIYWCLFEGENAPHLFQAWHQAHLSQPSSLSRSSIFPSSTPLAILLPTGLLAPA